MKASVHRLTAAGPIVKPDQDVIALLKELTARARRGEIKGIGYFAVNGADTVVSNWLSGCASGNLMASGAAKLFHRVVAASLE